jgi:hypothetical protein
VTPGITAPVVSRTIPEKALWADTEPGSSSEPINVRPRKPIRG